MLRLVGYCSSSFLRTVAMSVETDQYTQLINAITATKDGIEVNFTAKLDKLQREVEASQASTSQEVMAKMNKKAYHFKKKGNEAQFIFNSMVEDHIDAAKKTLGKMAPNSDTDKASLEKATTELDQGKEAIRVRQKHIHIADL